jgi:N-acetyl-beta-hexosaminidase
MLPESDERLKNTTNFENYDYFLINLDFFNQYMQNTLQINNGITNLWKLPIMVLPKQTGVGALCCLIWIMTDIKISMFATEFTMI